MGTYVVTLRVRPNNGRWTMMFHVESFSEAEEMALKELQQTKDNESEIISIKKDY